MTDTTEPTEDRKQHLIEGVRPVTQRDRLGVLAATPLTHGPTLRQSLSRTPTANSRPCDHGLFDEVSRAQTDLCDLIVSTKEID